MTLLKLENLTVTIDTDYGRVNIIEGIDLEMAPGEKLGIVGESGCGKSITALAIMSLLPKEVKVSGRILFKDTDLLKLSPRRMGRLRGNRMAMIFQEPMTALNPVKTIGAQIAESIHLHRRATGQGVRTRVIELMESVGLPVDRFPLGLYPHQLSGGQRQRVMIAIAIACEPDLLIADEPTTALDVTVQEQILDLILNLAESSGMGLIMISHDLGVIAQTTEQVLVMYTGNMVEKGSTVDVYQRRQHPYTRGLFAAVPRVGMSVTGPRRRLFSIPGQVLEYHLKTGGCDFAGRCQYVTAECRRSKPAAAPVTAGHRVWCHHPVAEEPS
jgi:peptide/nickel transport system ATP-binding protein